MRPWFVKRRRGGFVREVLVVMLGVLVALGLEHLLSEWREQQRVADTLRAMRAELVDFRHVFGVRLRAADCIGDKLDALDAWLAAGAPAGAVRQVGRPPYFFSSRGGWNGGAAELLARHRGPAVARMYGEVYQGVDEFAALAQHEQSYWARLMALEGHAGAVDDALRWQLREAVAGARNTHLLLAAIATQIEQRIGALIGAVGDDERSPLALDLPERPLCRPLHEAMSAG